jgi:hypothetical protein
MPELDSPEVKAAIKAAVDAAIEEATTGLKAKNSELLAKLKVATKNLEITPEEHNRVKEENERLQEQVADANKQLKAGVGEYERLKKAYETESGFVSRLLIDNGLSDALAKNGVKPELSAAAKALIASRGVSVKVDGDNRSAVIGDKSVSDYVSEWAKSDEGKHFVAAQQNTGGGATGGGGSQQGQKTMTRSDFDAKSQAERMAFAKSGGAVVD